MKHIILPLALLHCHIASADIGDFFIRHANMTAEELLTETANINDIFVEACETETFLSQHDVDEASCKEQIAINQKKCLPQFATQEKITGTKAIEKIVSPYVDCVIQFDKP